MLAAVRSAVAGCAHVAVVAAGYADRERLTPRPIAPAELIQAAALAGVSGCLLDTAVKDERSLTTWYTIAELTELVERAHAAGLTFGAAGRLGIADLARLRSTGADVAGVRSAVCGAGRRTAALSYARVRAAVAACAAATAA
jgi:uncharacterized protein (UPF0264 family)